MMNTAGRTTGLIAMALASALALAGCSSSGPEAQAEGLAVSAITDALSGTSVTSRGCEGVGDSLSFLEAKGIDVSDVHAISTSKVGDGSFKVKVQASEARHGSSNKVDYGYVVTVRASNKQCISSWEGTGPVG